MTETQKRNSSLFPGVIVFPELQRQKIPEHNKSREKKLQKILALNDGEFQRLKINMLPLQFKDFMNSVLIKEKHVEHLPQSIEAEYEPISRESRTLREKMQRKGWVVL